MAIIIPSKNIYNEIENKKILGNKINAVSVDIVNITNNNTYSEPVSNSQVTEFSPYDLPFVTGDSALSQTSNEWVGNNTYGLSFVGNVVEDKYYTIPEIKIKKSSSNKYISEILTGKTTQGNNYINFSKKVIEKVYKYEKAAGLRLIAIHPVPLEAEFYFSQSYNEADLSETLYHSQFVKRSFSFVYDGYESEIEPPQGKQWAEATISIPIEDDVVSTMVYRLNGLAADNLITAKNTFPTTQETDLSQIGYEEDDEYYYFKNIKILAERSIVSSATALNIPTYNSSDYVDKTYRTLNIESRQILTEATFTFYGNTIGIKIEDGNVTIGQNYNKDPFTIERNELLQDSAVVGEIKATQYIADSIISQYSKGKETATLLCGINDYYDEENIKIIDIKNAMRMTFKEFDEVIPYVLGKHNTDVPISLDSNGNPKKFVVASIEYIYDGAGWQKLSLLEK